MLFDGESFKSRHGLHSFLLLLGDRSLLHSKCETYLISSGQLFKDLSDDPTGALSLELYVLYICV